MSTVSLNLVFVTFLAFIMLANASPIETIEANDIILCPEGAPNALIDGAVVYPKENRCSMVGGMCVESHKCRSLVSAKGLCPKNQYRGAECCFELEPQYLPCHQP